MNTQLCVLGAGPGGYAAAFLRPDLGLQVPWSISNRGWAASASCAAASREGAAARGKSQAEAKQLAEWGIAFSDPTIDLTAMRARKEKVIATLTGGLKQLAAKRT